MGKVMKPERYCYSNSAKNLDVCQICAGEDVSEVAMANRGFKLMDLSNPEAFHAERGYELSVINCDMCHERVMHATPKNFVAELDRFLSRPTVAVNPCTPAVITTGRPPFVAHTRMMSALNGRGGNTQETETTTRPQVARRMMTALHGRR